MSIEGSETRQQVPPESAKDAISSESMTTMDRLQFLEKQYNRLSDLFQYVRAVLSSQLSSNGRAVIT